MPPLDPARLSLPAHGQRARELAEGTVVVECSKVLEPGTRAQLLLVPRLLRVDVTWMPDAIRLHTREFTVWPATWRAHETREPAAGRILLAIDVDFPDLPAPISGQARVTATERVGGTGAEVGARIVLTSSPG